MADIQFETEQEYTRPVEVGGPQGLVGLVQKLGLAKNDQQANHVLLGVAVIAVVLAIYFAWPNSGGRSGTPLLPGSELQTPGLPGR
ncbi:MAG: hypothetical protein Q7R90_03255 [bacterium]|nr:hypothetical protein [bacterium]